MKRTLRSRKAERVCEVGTFWSACREKEEEEDEEKEEEENGVEDIDF
jgi:hypothetical protein